jgi:C1A family cysteine protease
MSDERRPGCELGLGWLPDYPDFRDYTFERTEVASRFKELEQRSVGEMVKGVGVKETAKLRLPTKRDLRRWCSPIEDQGPLGSCTANAGVGIMEYFERRAFNKHIDASRLFLYKATRNLLHWTGDTGAYLRTTMGAMVLFGVPPEEYHPYVVADFDDEPSAFNYSFARNYEAIQYYRLDPAAAPRKALLRRIKLFLTFGLPSMFGFTVFSSIGQARDDGRVPFPCRHESVLGGHAVVAVGYDDRAEIENTLCDNEYKGALLIRNSWGTGWGDRGYGWLPYEYVLRGLAVDWWSLLKSEWVDTGKFGR